MLFDGDTFEYKGHTFKACIKDDIYMGPPWEEHDGHGPVSEWTTRDKRPGERLLYSDRGSKRYYDWQEAIRIAKQDGWDAPPYKTGTKGQRAERAVEADFKFLRAWCNDEWRWVGLIVKLLDENDEETGHEDACWGYDSDYVQDSMQAAHEHADNILHEVECGTFPVHEMGI